MQFFSLFRFYHFLLLFTFHLFQFFSSRYFFSFFFFCIIFSLFSLIFTIFSFIFDFPFFLFFSILYIAFFTFSFFHLSQAAGVIHSDFEKGFIRAETVSYNDMIQEGSEKAVKDSGLMRSEGKDYIMQEGDIVLFRFNV